jgi:NTE family protein
VLDRLLEDERLEIAAVTAASAGAFNAVALASGLLKDGRAGARAALDGFWAAVNQAGGRNVFGDMDLWSEALTPAWMRDHPMVRWWQSAASSVSPYEFNPFNLNPLRDILERQVDFDALHRGAPIKLYVSATRVRSGEVRIFRNGEVTCQAVLASACLPQLFQAVEIDGEPLWDGGYVANPALWPLFYEDTPADLLIVHVNPLERSETPRRAGDILDRLNEITFNVSLQAELRAVAFVQKLLDEDLLRPEARGRYRRVLLHAIKADDWLADLSLASKFETGNAFLGDLKARGRRAAERWLEHDFAAVGERSSIDVRAEFL